MKKKQIVRRKRDMAVSIDLDLDKNDELIMLIGRDSGIFYITKNKIIRYNSPDDLDPDMKYEDAIWTQNLVLPCGASDPIVARTIIQTKMMSEKFFSNGSDKYKTISDISWEVMHSLVSLRFIRDRLESNISEIAREIESDINSYTKGEKPKRLPIVEYYDIEFRSFANEVRRTLSSISELFLPLTGQSKFSQGKFHEAQEWAQSTRGSNSLLAMMLKNDQRWIKTWIDIRIAIEHPKKDKYVETMNFMLGADRKIFLPTWRFIHPDYNMSQPQNLLEVMAFCMDNLLKFYEDLLFALLDGHLPSNTKIFFEIIPEAQRNPDSPLRYKLSEHFLQDTE